MDDWMTFGSKWSERHGPTQPAAPLGTGPGGHPRPSRGSRTRLPLVVAVLAATACSGPDAPPPDADTSPADARRPKVLLVGIDGVRPDVLAEIPTPHLDSLAAAGTFTARTRTTTPSVSGPSWSSMLTGVWPEKHGVTDNEFGGRRYAEYPGFLDRIEQLRPELSTFAVVDWVPLMELEGGSTVLGPAVDRRELLDGYELGWPEADRQVVETAVRHLRDGDVDAAFVYLGNPDEISHQTGSIGEPYRNAIAEADRQVGLLVDAVRSRAEYDEEDWLLIVSTDHGRRPDGGHGGDTPAEMTTFILVSGPSAATGDVRRDSYIVDVAVTALTHLDIPIDSSWSLDGDPIGLH